MNFNDQKQFIVDRFTKELEDAGLGAYRIEVVRDTNYCFRLASTCYIDRQGHVLGYNRQPVQYFKVYLKKPNRVDYSYDFLCKIRTSEAFVRYLIEKHRNHWSLEDIEKLRIIQYRCGFDDIAFP